MTPRLLLTMVAPPLFILTLSTSPIVINLRQMRLLGYRDRKKRRRGLGMTSISDFRFSDDLKSASASTPKADHGSSVALYRRGGVRVCGAAFGQCLLPPGVEALGACGYRPSPALAPRWSVGLRLLVATPMEGRFMHSIAVATGKRPANRRSCGNRPLARPPTHACTTSAAAAAGGGNDDGADVIIPRWQ